MNEHHETFTELDAIASAHPGPLVEALALAELEFGSLVPDATNPHFGSKYVTLGALITATRGPLARHGLVLTQTLAPGASPPGVDLVTTLRHVSGATLESRVPVPAWKGPQDAGSLLTYLRRYSAAGLLNLASEQDDDAEGVERGTRATNERTRRFQERGATSQRSGSPRASQRERAPSSKDQGGVNLNALAEGLADAIDAAPTVGALDELVPSLAKLPAELRPPLRVRFSERRSALQEIERDSAELDALDDGDNPR